MIECYLYFKQVHTGSIEIGIGKVHANREKFIFRKFEGYMLSGIGSRSVPVDRLAGWQVGRLAGRLADTNVIPFECLKFSSGQLLKHLPCLNEDIVLLEL